MANFKLETVQDFINLSGDNLRSDPKSVAIQTLTGVAALMKHSKTDSFTEAKFEAGHLKKLFSMAGEQVPAEITSLINLAQTDDKDLVELPNMVAMELAFQILQKEGYPLVERTELKNFYYSRLKFRMP